MRFHEASTVLLIIGSAVVGPLETKRECSNFGVGGHVACRSIETVAQACERLQADLGAWQVAPREVLDRNHGPNGWDKNYPPGTWWLDRFRQVLCIPAPSGLKH